ncbi:gliding motility associated protien GldN [bacterium A37T11]|nr:gliding motility associated protien GldN [bacterium A37T11]
MKRLIGLLLIYPLFSSLYAQQENLANSTTPISAEKPPVDGYYDQSDIENREVVPYANIRPGDVIYSKRIWREFDTREKMNTIYASPKSSLINILMNAVMAGELTAYDPTPTKEDPNGDSFKTRLDPSQIMGRMGVDSALVEEYDNEGNVKGSHMESREFDPQKVIRFRIKEDWILDKQRSVFEPRIIGIAPLITPDATVNAGGVQVDSTGMVNESPSSAVSSDSYPAFWIYFPEARHILVNKEVSTRNNDATGLSFDDVFIKRLFSSYIVKESNPEDLRVRDYASGIDRLYESERIKQSLLDYEQDLWSY